MPGSAAGTCSRPVSCLTAFHSSFYICSSRSVVVSEAPVELSYSSQVNSAIFYRASASNACTAPLSVRPSNAGIVTKRRDISSHFQRSGRVITLVFKPHRRYKFQWEPLSVGVKYTGVGQICVLRPKSPFISDTVRDRPMITMLLLLIGSHR